MLPYTWNCTSMVSSICHTEEPLPVLLHSIVFHKPKIYEHRIFLDPKLFYLQTLISALSSHLCMVANYSFFSDKNFRDQFRQRSPPQTEKHVHRSSAGTVHYVNYIPIDRIRQSFWQTSSAALAFAYIEPLTFTMCSTGSFLYKNEKLL